MQKNINRHLSFRLLLSNLTSCGTWGVFGWSFYIGGICIIYYVGFIDDSPKTMWDYCLISIFFDVGLFYLFLHYKEVIKTIYLLKFGIISKAKIIKREKAFYTISDYTIIKLTLEFTDDDKSTCQFHENVFEYLYPPDVSEYRIIFDPDKANNALLIDNMSIKPIFDDNNNFVTMNFWPVLSIIFPILAIGLTFFFVFNILKFLKIITL